MPWKPLLSLMQLELHVVLRTSHITACLSYMLSPSGCILRIQAEGEVLVTSPLKCAFEPLFVFMPLESEFGYNFVKPYTENTG